ncbi:O-antigen ligase family protein [Pseudoblastomonas halimionae]|uniref:O-antigen ligase-related domain-containing protein n=1 Tax=Alteriqipengyuania halimionae TaxID=1926630 RepID=A0A6I4U9H1_9SPHN|nr:O-antigen ligase family protein [Alteriqipengyuania halimionae]MXP10901.1 hypothetical protein [Alteriqipengyuania halimionae]
MGRKFTLKRLDSRSIPFFTLVVLMIAVFLMGGGSRGDIISLILLRPLGVICLAIGLVTLKRDQVHIHRLALGIMAAIVVLIGLHVVPLPPAIWSALPGRDIAVEAGRLVGLEDQWRPLTLSPHRGWNAFYAMLVPAAAMILAMQLTVDQHRKLLLVILALAATSALLAVAQVASGLNRSLFPYAVTNTDYPVGLFANRNHSAAMLCIALPMLAVFGLKAKGAVRALVHTATGATAIVLVLLALATGSRAGFVGLVIAALFSAALIRAWEPPVRKRGARSLKPFYIVGAIATVFVTAFIAIAFSRADGLGRLAETSAADENRWPVWETVVGFMGQYQPFGSGVGSFVELFQVHEPRDMLGTTYWNHAHNDWLEWILELGVPAVILLVLAMVAIARTGRTAWARLPLGRTPDLLSWVGLSALFILGLWSLVDYPLRVPSLACVAAVAAVWMRLPAASAGQAKQTARP